ncbi:O-acetyl-ADP-ribose deacetylase [Lactobacillus sp. Sy-1]|uniref:O-acetyl-ADP-ribose deacetylase n=1 Tax=Lactobacillus sp. Sy-1 TaxID=2109645 RepID=UPI001C5AE10E|nr:O-acetyl-ADP-ribose deacetylase [Lactobacillus sp. Sy-1]MBW1606042.1 O-acetyl-ADP-ribose deacetylase [Lactobacillus sp. Sy-1]
MVQISLTLGDITKFNGDAIVNAANHSLMGGGGVDGAIHHAAGPELNNACVHLNGCQTGEAKITPGYWLPAKYIIHTVGPVWHGEAADADQLQNCYRNSLKVAVKNHCHTVAFPSISTGAYGYPVSAAAKVAITTLRSINADVDVTIVCFDKTTLAAYQSALAN